MSKKAAGGLCFRTCNSLLPKNTLCFFLEAVWRRAAAAPSRCRRREHVTRRGVLLTFRMLSDLADELSPAHVHSPLDLASLRSRIVFEDFHHQGRVVRDSDARL
jgi:hypothetical protein